MYDVPGWKKELERRLEELRNRKARQRIGVKGKEEPRAEESR